jgi:hypothetical protein
MNILLIAGSLGAHSCTKVLFHSQCCAKPLSLRSPFPRKLY